MLDPNVNDGSEMSSGGCGGEGSCIVKIFYAGGLLWFIFGLVTVFNFLVEGALRRELGGCDATSLAQVILCHMPTEILGAILLLCLAFGITCIFSSLAPVWKISIHYTRCPSMLMC